MLEAEPDQWRKHLLPLKQAQEAPEEEEMEHITQKVTGLQIQAEVEEEVGTLLLREPVALVLL